MGRRRAGAGWSLEGGVGIEAHRDGLREPWGVEDVAGPVVPTDRVGGAESVFLLG